MARLHFPIDFRRDRTPFRDSPAFPVDCLPFSPAVLRPLSQGRRGILLAHHGYTWWMRYGQTKEKGHRTACPTRKSPHASRPGRKKGSKTDPKKEAIPDFPKKEESQSKSKEKTPRVSSLCDSAVPKGQSLQTISVQHQPVHKVASQST